MTLSVIPSIWPMVILAIVILGGLSLAWALWFKKLFMPLIKAKKPELPEERPILKSDEDRVMEILRNSGGKMYQTELVRQMDVSKSKLSSLLGTMEKAGKIRRIRMGRKNLVVLKQPEETQGESKQT